jgi:hypothetical protein
MPLGDVGQCAETSNGCLVLDVPGHALGRAGFGCPAGNIGGVERRVGYKGRNHRALDLIPDVLIEPLENLDHPYRRLARGVVDIERTWLRTCPPADPPTVPRDGSPPTLCAGASRP